MKLAEYKCLSCSYVWKEKAGPVFCPICKNIWINWLNYNKDFDNERY